MDLKQFILENVSSDTYYHSRFPQWTKGNVCCPWHEDKHPSLSLNLKNGGAKCHAASCAKSLGNIVHFEAERYNLTDAAASIKLYSEFCRRVVDASDIELRYANLQRHKKVLGYLLTDCGITKESVSLFQLGWDDRLQRVSIPITDRWKNVINLRLYKLPRLRTPKEEGMKVINFTKDDQKYGALDLFPWSSFIGYDVRRPLFIMASEKETMLGIQGGLQCICSTSGEGSWSPDWTEYMRGFDVAVVRQRDKAGEVASQKLFATLQVVTSVQVIEPPTQHKDFADFIVSDGGQAIALLALLKEGKRDKAYAVQGRKLRAPSSAESFSSVPARPPYFSEDLIELAQIAASPERLNKVIKTQGIVAAKATVTYTIPWKFQVKLKNQPSKVFSVSMGRDLLRFVKASDGAIRGAVAEMVGDESVTCQALEYVTATEVEVIPAASVDKDVPYVTQHCIYIGPRIESNVPYELEIIPTNDVRTQETIGLIIKCTPMSKWIETATFSDEDFATLQVFQPDRQQSVWEKMQAVVYDLSQNHTKIFNRPDWHLVALLTWISPIGWKFPYEKETQRGWLNSLAVGDTQTGKSKVVQSLQQVFQCGSIVNAENCTYVGLVGGAVKMGSGQFMLRWGRIPLADKQLVVIEELSGLSVEEISNMSDVRSSGIARLDKGGLSAETNARTRLLALSNVRPVNKTLAQYLSGVRAIQELIGHGEDIARFDLVITLVDNEVAIEVINRPFTHRGLKNAIPESCWQRLCQFTWSLAPEQIKFNTEAYFLLLDKTKELSEIYDPSIPVFKGAAGRYKIARIAAAIATLQFHWDGKVIRVTEDHIEATCQFLRSLYDKPSFGYLEWSKQIQDRRTVKDVEELNIAIRETVKSQIKRAKVIEALIHSGKFTRDELCAIGSIQIIQADNLIGVFLRERVIRKGEANVWEITPAGKSWMEKHLLDITPK